MSKQFHQFYKHDPEGHFYKILALHELPDLHWENLSKEIPALGRGWFELSRLSLDDRVEFTRDYWLSKLPLLCHESDLEQQFVSFFDRVEDVGILVTQQKANTAFEAHMVYELKEDAGYFHGSPPATKETIVLLKKQFVNFSLPSDYLSFLEIHDGFSKYIDTGLIKAKDMAITYFKFQQRLSKDIILNSEGDPMNPKQLVPFYESQHLHCYQCFNADWYPIEEMGNILFCNFDDMPSQFVDEHYLENRSAFTSFLSWLIHYLESD